MVTDNSPLAFILPPKFLLPTPTKVTKTGNGEGVPSGIKTLIVTLLGAVAGSNLGSSNSGVGVGVGVGMGMGMGVGVGSGSVRVRVRVLGKYNFHHLE